MRNNFEKEKNYLLKEKYNRKINKKFFNDVVRIEKGEPLDYVIGFTEFLGCKIDLSKKPLIPRPETAFWVNECLNSIVRQLAQQSSHKSSDRYFYAKSKILRILDIFAGSGCIGIAVLKNLEKKLPIGTHIKVVFAEKDKNLLKQIKINCKTNGIKKERYKIVKSDIFKNINQCCHSRFRGNNTNEIGASCQTRFDFIFANPPYIPKRNIAKVQKSVLLYEPREALFGGQDGLFYIRKFLKQAKNYLSENGSIFMEFDLPQKKEIEKLLKKFGYKNWQFHKDQYNKYRWVEIAG